MSFLQSLSQSGPEPPSSPEHGVPAPGPDTPQCSRKGCRAAATWQLLWNNPKIHTAERRKVWLACGEHKDWLQNYLTERSLFKDVLPLNEAAGQTANNGQPGSVGQ